MKIDSHQHFWKYDPLRDTWITEEMQRIKRDFTPEDLKPILEVNEMDGSVAVQAEPSENETGRLLDLADKYSFIKGVVGWVDLTDDRVEDRLIHFKNASTKLKGLRHLVQSEPDRYFLCRKDFMYGISLLKQWDFTYDILIYPQQLPATIQFVTQFPNQKFVLDHLGKPPIKKGIIEPWASQIKILAQNPQVWCKVSGLITEASWKHWKEDDLKPYLDVIFESFGTQRILFGSDWPVCLLAGSYTQVKQTIVHYLEQMSPKEKDLVFGENAIQFYHL